MIQHNKIYVKLELFNDCEQAKVILKTTNFRLYFETVNYIS